MIVSNSTETKKAGESIDSDSRRPPPQNMNDPAGVSGLMCRYAVPLSLAMAAVVFIVDLFTPLGVASGVPYSLAVLAALNARGRRYVFGLAVFCSLLTFADLSIGPGRGGSELWKVLTNRGLAIFMIWITTMLGVMRRKAEQRQRDAEVLTRRHLADLAHMGRRETAGQLATNLAHELNQPLSAISLQSEIAVRFARGDMAANRQPILEAVREITEQSQRAAAIIKTLREMVRKSGPRQSPVDVHAIVRDVTRIIDAQARHQGVDVQLTLVRTPKVMGNKIQLEQVLLNLLQNSLDALETVPQGSRRILVTTAFRESGCIEICVGDTGVGIAHGETQRVFERFYTSKLNGMGMGLAICRSIVEAHGGQLWAAPNPPRGAMFCFCLPVPRNAVRSSLPANSRTP